ncbi:sulfotransferase family 2 domain-containing protein [Roseovarius halotolerans]|nr:sulfotransferase family 2 domain-containing protein [Roseovarius halotolerans]
MPLVTSPMGHIFFAHVPKTGGTSIEDYLIKRFGGISLLEDAGTRDTAFQRDVIQPVQHLTARELNLLLPPDIHYCFAIVRDPVERIVSEYRFQSGISKASSLGFSTWLRLVFSAARRDPRVYDNHIRPQSDLVPEAAEVFYFENGFQPVLQRIDELFGTTDSEAEIRHLLKQPKPRPRLFRQDLDLVHEFYAEDYRRFGYDRPALDGTSHDRYAALRAILAAPMARVLLARQRRRWLR